MSKDKDYIERGNKSRKKCAAKVTNIMKDGTIRDSMEGVIIPHTGQFILIYEMIENIARRVQEEHDKNQLKN